LEFGDKVEYASDPNSYYYILREIGKLHRNELREFKKRFERLLNYVKMIPLQILIEYQLVLGAGLYF